MIVKLLTVHNLEFLSLKGGCKGWSESTHVKIPHCGNHMPRLTFFGGQNDLENRGGNSPRFSIRKIFQFNPGLGQKCSETTNKMFKRTKHP